jgi:hypothetical protein
MMKHVIKSAVLTIPLVTACGRDNKHDAAKEAPPPLPITDQANEPKASKYVLAQSILFEAVIRKLIDYPAYEQHIKVRNIPVFKGKKKEIIAIDDLETKGIRNRDDAFQDLEWIKDFKPNVLGATIRSIAFHAELITDEEFAQLNEAKIVPTFREWFRVDIPEDKLLTHWIISANHAFAGSVIPKGRE